MGDNDEQLTPRLITIPGRELAVLRLLVRGREDRQIALALTMKFATVRTHIRSLMHRTGCCNRTEIAAWALAPGNEVLQTGRGFVGSHPAQCRCGMPNCPEANRAA